MFGVKYSRLKFWIISIILFIIAIPILIAKNILKDSVNADTILIIAVSGILVSAIWMNTLANRIRDYGDNPWVALFSIVPLANIGLALYYGIAKSNVKEVTQKSDSNSLSSAVYNHSKDIINGIKPAINEYRETHTSPNNDSGNNNTTIDESKIYEDIMNEIEQDNKVKSTWAKALSQSDGNKDKAESLYISKRFEELKYQQSYQKNELNLSEQIENIEIEKEVEIKRDSSSKMIVFLIILISVLLFACIIIFPLIYFNLNKDASTTISSSMQSDNTSIQNNTNVQKDDVISNNANSITNKTDTTNVKNKWKYKDWEIENIDDNFIKAFTIGKNRADAFIIIKKKKDCNPSFLYTTTRLFDESVQVNKNDILRMDIKVDNEIFNSDTPIYEIYNLGFIKQLMSTPYPLYESFIEKLKNGNTIQTFTAITSNEEYSLNGFTKTYNVLNEACRDINALNRYTESNKELSINKEFTVSNNIQSSKLEVSSNKPDAFKADINDLVINLTDSRGKEKLMKLSFSIKSNEPTIVAIFEEFKAEIIDVVISQISSRSSEELLTVDGKNLLKDELLQNINNVVNEVTKTKPKVQKNNIKEILFTTFVIK